MAVLKALLPVTCSSVDFCLRLEVRLLPAVCRVPEVSLAASLAAAFDACSSFFSSISYALSLSTVSLYLFTKREVVINPRISCSFRTSILERGATSKVCANGVGIPF